MRKGSQKRVRIIKGEMGRVMKKRIAGSVGDDRF